MITKWLLDCKLAILSLHPYCLVLRWIFFILVFDDKMIKQVFAFRLGILLVIKIHSDYFILNNCWLTVFVTVFIPVLGDRKIWGDLTLSSCYLKDGVTKTKFFRSTYHIEYWSQICRLYLPINYFLIVCYQ